MIEIIITENDNDRRLDRFLSNKYQHLPSSLVQRWIREKRIRLNGKHQAASTRIKAGDSIKLFVDHDKLETSSKSPCQAAPLDKELIVYEDDNIIVVNKPSGLSVQPDERGGSLICQIRAYFGSNEPELCHRLDRNTSGLVVAAKNGAALRAMNEVFANRLVRKFYVCLAHGKVSPKTATLKHFLRRDLQHSKVDVFAHPVTDGKTAILHYKVIEYFEDTSLLEVELYTGRTHQIRAQFAHIGHPLVGDGKYGKDVGGQKLCSYKLKFGKIDGKLSYLSGQVFELDTNIGLFRHS